MSISSQVRDYERPKTIERGLWVQSHIQTVRTLGEGDGEGSMELIRMDVPGIRAMTSKAQMARTSAATRIGREALPGRESPLPRLPTEIIEHILSYLIPVDVTYHIFAHPPDRKTTVIHFVEKKQTNRNPAVSRHFPSRRNLTALASVNRRLNKMFMSTFYGSNRWILELSDDASWPTPTFKHEPAFLENLLSVVKLMAGPPEIHSWARLFNVPFNGCWPLNERSIPFVRDLTVAITVLTQPTVRDALELEVRRFTDLLKHSQLMCSLTIDVQRNAALEASRRLSWNIPGYPSHVLKVRKSKYRCPEGCSVCRNMSWLWDLFKDVACASNVVLSGHISEKTAQQLEESMKRKSKPKCVG